MKIGEIMHKLEDLGVEVLNQADGVMLLSLPTRAPNGMISEELAEYVNRTINQYITSGKLSQGVIQIQYVVRKDPSE